jgi:hypothetical protein
VPRRRQDQKLTAKSQPNHNPSNVCEIVQIPGKNHDEMDKADE